VPYQGSVIIENATYITTINDLDIIVQDIIIRNSYVDLTRGSFTVYGDLYLTGYVNPNNSTIKIFTDRYSGSTLQLSIPAGINVLEINENSKLIIVLVWDM
jgi:hypothetical protein